MGMCDTVSTALFPQYQCRFLRHSHGFLQYAPSPCSTTDTEISLSTATFLTAVVLILEYRPQSLEKKFFCITTHWITACTNHKTHSDISLSTGTTCAFSPHSAHYRSFWRTVFMLHLMHQMQSTITDVHSVCLSVTRFNSASLCING